MHRLDGQTVFSATDLVAFLSCDHQTQLERAALAGLVERPVGYDNDLTLLMERGVAHEQEVLARFKAEGRDIFEIVRQGEDYGERVRKAVADTLTAMKQGKDLIYQAALLDNGWQGYADFLLRVDVPSELGAWSYEVADAKLSRHTKAGALIQMCLYSELLARIQGRVPEHMHVALGPPARIVERHRVADYGAYFRQVKGRFEAATREPAAPAYPPADTYPDPVEYCDVCRWAQVCGDRWRRDDHLSLVAGITRHQRRALVEHGVTTTEQLGRLKLPVGPAIEHLNPAGLVRIREQARLQVAGRKAGKHLYELITPVEVDRGLAALPPPSPGDLFFDIEGAPYAFDDGLEYLFGVVELGEGKSGAPVYAADWALDRVAERRMFERFVDMLMARLERHPDMHVYHYNHYEPTALKRLMGRYGTREDSVDTLLRREVFVDLYRVVRQGVRASVESYSIKKIEPLYRFTRDADLDEATDARIKLEMALERGDSEGRDKAILELVETYNRDDCVSTLRLRDWLEERRVELARVVKSDVPRPTSKDEAPSEKRSSRQAEIGALMSRLTRGLPEDSTAPMTPEQRATWLLAQMLEWHRREEKSYWWDYFRMRGLNDDQLIEDSVTLGGLEYAGVAGRDKKSLLHSFGFPKQEHGLEIGASVEDAKTGERAGEVFEIDEARGTLVLKRKDRFEDDPPSALIPQDRVTSEVLRDSLFALAEWVADRGIRARGGWRAALRLLLRDVPKVGQKAGAPLVRHGEDPSEAAVRLAMCLDETVLPIQGPPGAGKTYTGARMILALVAGGARVGITGNSHKVVTKLLEETIDAAKKARTKVRAIQKGREGEWCDRAAVIHAVSNEEIEGALAEDPPDIVAGTAWLWARDAMASTVDVLFVDEAGQMALANVLAISRAAKSLVLLGDPQQLNQPVKGVHPPGAEVSALAHLLEGKATVQPERGIFLDSTWRLHPDVCSFTSEVFYAGRLRAREGLERQVVKAGGPLAGTGLRFIPVTHTGNQNESVEEAKGVGELVRELLKGKPTWVDGKGREHPLTLDDVLVVAPYNAQVAALADELPGGARVGTVDKFQGQEAPIVIYSMATSSADDAPRGMEFLYNGNRFNVATSRARCVAAVVCSPELLRVRCRTPRQMQLANAFCRALEIAETMHLPLTAAPNSAP